MERIRVLLADDHALFRRGIVETLADEETIDVVGEASSGQQAVEKARALKPHLVLMDVHMPNGDGIEATRQLRAEMPQTRVLMLTVSARDEDLVDAMKSGARGYMLKNAKPDQLIQAVQFVASGGTLVSPELADTLLRGMGDEKRPSPEPPLSPVEEEVLRLLAQGNSDEAIAYRLPTTEMAVRTLIRNILHKLRLGQRYEAVAYARRIRLARSEDDRPYERPEEIPGLSDSIASVETVGADEKETAIPNEGDASPVLVGDIEMVVAAPVMPEHVLTLHRWLKEVAKARIVGVSGSFGAATVLRLNLPEPVSIWNMLNELQIVEQATAYPRAAGGTIQLRLVLKNV